MKKLLRKTLINFVTSNIQPKDYKRSMRKMLYAATVQAPNEALPTSIDEFEHYLDAKQSYVLMLDHSWGGGANLYSSQRIQKLNQEGISGIKAVCLQNGTIILTLQSKNHVYSACVSSLLDMEYIIQTYIDRIIVNELVSWTLGYSAQINAPLGLGKDIPAILEQLVYLSMKTDTPVEHCFHDLFPLCPSITLLNSKHQYCGIEQNETKCLNCMNNHPEFPHPHFHITRWRQAWQFYFNHVSTVLFFSRKIKDMVLEVFDIPECNIQIKPHIPLHEFTEKIHIPSTGPMIVGVVGHIGDHKGASIIVELGHILEQQSPKDKIIIIGKLSRRPETDNIILTGSYAHEDLPKILQKHGVTIGCISSVWPETFSYVTQELMQLELPLVCFPLGAPSERIAEWPKGAIADEISAISLYETLKTLDHNRL